MRPPNASGGRPLCPKKPGGYGTAVCDALQKKTNKHFDYCYLQGSAWKYPSQKLVHYARKKLETTQASRHRASGGSPSGRPTGVLWLDIAATRGLEEHVILSDQKWFLLQTSPIKQNKRYWVSVSHRLTVTCKQRGEGDLEVGVAVYLA